MSKSQAEEVTGIVWAILAIQSEGTGKDWLVTLSWISAGFCFLCAILLALKGKEAP